MEWGGLEWVDFLERLFPVWGGLELGLESRERRDFSSGTITRRLLKHR